MGCRPIRSQSNPPHLREWSEPSGSSLGAQARCFAVRRFALAMTGSSHRKMARQESPAVQSFSDQGVVDRLPSSPPSQEVCWRAVDGLAACCTVHDLRLKPPTRKSWLYRIQIDVNPEAPSQDSATRRDSLPNRSVARQSVPGDTAGCSESQDAVRQASRYLTKRQPQGRGLRR